MAEALIQQFKQEAEKTLEYLRGEFSKLQTGRANASLVENIGVEAYGQKQPLKAVAGISVPDGTTIVVQPWDPSILQSVEAALQQADLGTSPVNDGNVLRINLPPMTEERREHLKKTVHQLAEEARISVRRHRQEIQDEIKKEEDEDRKHTLQKRLDEAVKEVNDQIEQLRDNKENEVMTV